MAKTEFKDVNNNILAYSVLPDGFRCEAVFNVTGQQLDQNIRLELKAVKDRCSIHMMSGISYSINKMPQPKIYYYIPPEQDPNATPKELTDIRYELDETASGLWKKKAKDGKYFDLSDKFMKKANIDLQKYIRDVADDIYIGSLASPTPIGGIFRNYLLDGGLAFYGSENEYMSICIYRVGVETDLVSGQQGVSEILSDKPFSKAEPTMNAAACTAAVKIPYIFYMFTDKKEDLKTFMNFVDGFELSSQFLDFEEQFYNKNKQMLIQQASMARMADQAFIDATWQMNKEQLASMDRIRDMVSHDMDRFHADMDKQRQESNSRITSSITDGENLDDRIQRKRHETMMDVETYERSDGTTVEYDSRADRVFENDLDQRVHFGTEHYHGDYVPDGWHEMKKK